MHRYAYYSPGTSGVDEDPGEYKLQVQWLALGEMLYEVSCVQATVLFAGIYTTRNTLEFCVALWLRLDFRFATRLWMHFLREQLVVLLIGGPGLIPFCCMLTTGRRIWEHAGQCHVGVDLPRPEHCVDNDNHYYNNNYNHNYYHYYYDYDYDYDYHYYYDHHYYHYHYDNNDNGVLRREQ